ncbi:PE family protein [Mycobacterium sp. TY815]|uniref:PE family protein n=1 Tax=Mycobacterium sp. TY815 TaxID=3050581 RepID=UPI002741DC5E|nr:PE family protein [Mycobacterium sp. TY815]MDP7705113.1 PE family protein [Mycobacterium sp. TY815]
MSFVIAVPELVEVAAEDLEGIRSAVGEATASAAAATTSVLPAGADEVSTAIAALFGAHGQAFQAFSTRATLFHNEFVSLLTSGAAQYASAEATAAALLAGSGASAGTSPVEPLSSFAGAVAAPYQTLFANTVANLQSLGSAIAANPMPFLRQLIANQGSYLQTAAVAFVDAVRNAPAAIANLPLSIQGNIQVLANFQPSALAQSVINNQIGYFNTISTSLQAAGKDFMAGLQALPASFQAAGQALQAGDLQGAVDDVSAGFVNLFLTGFSGELDFGTGFVNVTPEGAFGDLTPIFAIPGQMAQNFTNLLPAGSIPAMISQNLTNVIDTATDTSQWINLGVSSLPIPLHVGLPVVLALDAVGPVLTTGDAMQSSLASLSAAVQTGDVAGAAAAILAAPANVANGFLNGQTALPLNAGVSFPGGSGVLNSTTYLPLGGILTPLQGGQLITDITPGVPFPLGGAEFGGILPGLLTYLPEQFAQAIGAVPPAL